MIITKAIAITGAHFRIIASHDSCFAFFKYVLECARKFEALPVGFGFGVFKGKSNRKKAKEIKIQQ